MRSSVRVRNLVIGLFIGFFVTAGFAIVIAVRLDKAHNRAMKASLVNQQDVIKRIVDANTVKIDTLIKRYAQESDSLNTVIKVQQVKLDAFGYKIIKMQRVQTELSNALEDIAKQRDSTLQGIQIK
jgi:hypothetical protein